MRAYLQTLPQNDASFRVVHTEVESANGIADVIHVHLRKDWQRSAAIGKIAPQWAFALRGLPYRRVFTTSLFADLTGASHKTAISVLRTFEKAGFCRQGVRAHCWQKIKQPVQLASHIVAIEAKLANWRRALAQAYRYLDFATESWVLLDSVNAAPAIRNIAMFRRLNIGLAVIGRETPVRRLFVPSKQEPKSPIRHWGMLSLIGRRSL